MSAADARPGMDWQEIYQLLGPNAREAADLRGVLADLDFVAQAADLLATVLEANPEEHEDQVVVRALWISALVTYARCFGTGKRLGLSLADIEALGRSDINAFHRHQIDMRNKHVAHSVNPFETTTVGAMVGLLDDGSTGVVGVAFLASSYIAPGAEEARSMARLARLLLRRVQARLEECTPKVLQEAQAESPDELRRRPVAGIEIPEPTRSADTRDTE